MPNKARKPGARLVWLSSIIHVPSDILYSAECTVRTLYYLIPLGRMANPQAENDAGEIALVQMNLSSIHDQRLIDDVLVSIFVYSVPTQCRCTMYAV